MKDLTIEQIIEKYNEYANSYNTIFKDYKFQLSEANKHKETANKAKKRKDLFFGWPQKTKLFKKLVPDLDSCKHYSIISLLFGFTSLVASVVGIFTGSLAVLIPALSVSMLTLPIGTSYLIGAQAKESEGVYSKLSEEMLANCKSMETALLQIKTPLLNSKLFFENDEGLILSRQAEFERLDKVFDDLIKELGKKANKNNQTNNLSTPSSETNKTQNGEEPNEEKQ